MQSVAEILSSGTSKINFKKIVDPAQHCEHLYRRQIPGVTGLERDEGVHITDEQKCK